MKRQARALRRQPAALMAARQGPACCGSSSLSLPMCTESSPSSGQPGIPRHCQGTQSCCAASSTPCPRGALTPAEDSVLLCVHKHGSPAGHRQPSVHSHEFRTRTIQSLSMCQLDNLMSKARVQRWEMRRMNRLKGLIYRNINHEVFLLLLA